MIKHSEPTTRIEAIDLLALEQALEGLDVVTSRGNNPHQQEKLTDRDLTGPVAYLYFQSGERGGPIGRVLLLDREACNAHNRGLPPTQVCRWVALPESLEVIEPPDDYQAWRELNNVLHIALERLPEWVSDPNTRSWWLE